MNLYTLKFAEDNLESGYVKYQHPYEYSNYYSKCVVFIPPLVISSILNLSLGHYSVAMGQIGLLILLLLAIISGRRDKIALFEIFICLSQIECTFLAVLMFKSFTSELNFDQNHFILGIALAYFQIRYELYEIIKSYSNGINFMIKAFTILSQMIIVCSFFLDVHFWIFPCVQVYLIQQAILLQSTYINEKEKRLKYLADKQLLQWNTILNDSLGISIVKYKFDKSKNQLQLIGSNREASTRQNITDQEQFIQFLRTTTGNSLINSNSPKKLNLEQISHSIFLKPQFCQKIFNHNCNKPQQLDGHQKRQNQQEEIFNIKVVKYYDKDPCLMLIFKPDILKQSHLRESRLKEDLRTMVHFIKVVQNNCNLLLHKDDKKFRSRNHHFEIRFLIYQISNTLLNLRVLKNEINLNKQRILQTFKLSTIFDKLQKSFSHECKKKKVNLKFHMSTDHTMVSIEWAVFLCLYNLIMNAIQNSRAGHLVQLFSSSIQDDTNKHVIIFRITNIGTELQENIFKLLPCIEPKTNEQFIYNSQFTKNQLGLAACVKMLVVIGQNNFIQISSRNRKCEVVIKIYENITECQKIRGLTLHDTIKVSDHLRFRKQRKISEY